MLNYRDSCSFVGWASTKSKRRWRLTQHKHNYFLYAFVAVDYANVIKEHLMQYRKLGNTDIQIPLIGLGTMTWGQQNNLQEACEQMDYALDKGVNFFDAAEMYPVPPRAETTGDTERCIGEWFAQTGKRSEVVLATKVSGRADTRPDWHILEVVHA